MLEHSCQFYSIEIANPNYNEQVAGLALLILPCKRPPEAQSQQFTGTDGVSLFHTTLRRHLSLFSVEMLAHRRLFSSNIGWKTASNEITRRVS